MKAHVFVILHLEESNMGFIQKLASRNPRVLEKKPVKKKCKCKIPKLTLRYVFNLKNWK